MKRLLSCLLSASFGLAAAAAHAQEAFPSRPIKLVIPQSPGSGGDIVGRLLADHLAASLKQVVVVDNKAGANGILAASSLTKEKADGYTVMLGLVSQLSFNQFLYKNVPYDGLRDFSYVSPVVETPYLLVASKASGIRSVNDLLAQARANPGKLNYASAGIGNMTHLSMALLASRAGIDLKHIPYKGSGPALTSVIAGETTLMVSVLGAALTQAQAGSVVPVAVIGPSRVKALPNVPTLAEAGIAMPRIPGWYALVAPPGLNDAVRDRLAGAVHGFLTDPAVKTRLQDLYLDGMPGSGTELKQRARADADVWARFIKDNNIQAD